MFEPFYPQEIWDSTYDIPFETWKDRGIKGVIFDIDNTLVPHGAPADERAIALFEHLKKLGFKTCLLSNNKEARVKHFASQVKSPYIHKGGKPSKRGYKNAMACMGTGPKETLFVGDQLFTDVYGANRAGLKSILVKPIDPKEEIQIVLKRYLERPVLYFYRKSRKKNLKNMDT